MAWWKKLCLTLKEFPRIVQNPVSRPRTHILTVFLLLLSLFLLSRSYKYDHYSSSKASAVALASRFLLADTQQTQMIQDLASCDIFDGDWVPDDHARPVYEPGSCPYLDDSFNCFKNRRPDSDYLKYRWKPRGCHIPRFDGLKMLRLLRGKRVVFVGDSLNRNMWESLVCALRESLKDKTKISQVSGRRDSRTQGFHSFRFREYGCSIDFIKSPFLVQEWKNSTLRLDMMQASKSHYHDADIIIFNTGHWWNHHKTSNGRNYFQEGRHVYEKLAVSEALSKALKTWGEWVDSKVNSRRTRVLFSGFSASHYRGGQWNSGGKCDGEREPIRKERYLGGYPWTMRIVERVIREMKTPVLYLNITRMTDFRKDGHPSIYRAHSDTPLHHAHVIQDCSHWCLPGIPDSWNHLLYSILLLPHNTATSAAYST